jgi:hypothetical protein
MGCVFAVRHFFVSRRKYAVACVVFTYWWGASVASGWFKYPSRPHLPLRLPEPSGGSSVQLGEAGCRGDARAVPSGYRLRRIPRKVPPRANSRVAASLFGAKLSSHYPCVWGLAPAQPFLTRAGGADKVPHWDGLRLPWPRLAVASRCALSRAPTNLNWWGGTVALSNRASAAAGQTSGGTRRVNSEF